MTQLKMLAPTQTKCLECGVVFIGLSKDITREWANGEFLGDEWLTARNWASDRVYQQNIRFCAADCAAKHFQREAMFEAERIRHKTHGKYR